MKTLRTIALTGVEPQPMSLRVPAKMRLLLDLQYTDKLGLPIDEDISAQMQLTGRTSGHTDVYAVPATDIINGKARATIPSGILTDMNGYNVRLYGTVKQEPMLIAMGTLRLTAAAGIESMEPDVIDSIPINIPYSFAYTLDIVLWQDAGKGTPFDLASATLTAAIYPSQGDNSTLAFFSVVPVGPGHVLLQLTQTQVDSLPGNCWWSLRASNAAGVTTLAEGTVTCTGAVVAPGGLP